MQRLSPLTAMVILLAAAAPASAQVPAVSVLPRGAPQEPGSQLVPEAQPPFSPAPQRAAPAKAAPDDDKSAARRPTVGVEGVGAGLGSSAPAPQCDARACAITYRSFRAADCTYQPYTGGPRRICEQ